jgi:hypothetical protein
MTINKFGWLNQLDFSTTSTATRRNLAALGCTVQQGVVEESAAPAIAARIVPYDDAGKPGPVSLVELSSCDRRGISFHHQLPLSARRAVISVKDEDFGNLEAEVSLSWCRFNRMGHYTSGGRFVQPPGRIA